MALIWRRQITVQVGGLTIGNEERPPRISVRLSRDGAQSAAECDVRLYNVSPASERHIERGSELIVRAGYEQGVAQVFSGVLKTARRERSSDYTARVLLLRGGDETVDPKRPGGGNVTRSYIEPRNPRNIAADIAADMGLRLGASVAALPDQPITWAFAGTGRDALAQLCARFPGVTSYVLDGEIRFTRSGVPDPDAKVVQVTPDSGLIGVPEYTDEGYAIRTFLHPSITMGSVIDLRSDTLSGRFKVAALSMDLDNWSGPFRGSYELSELNGSARPGLE